MDEKILLHIEKMTVKFMETVAKIEIAHFQQLQKQSDAQQKVFTETVDKLLETLHNRQEKKEDNYVEKITRFDQMEENPIEKSAKEADPLEEMTPAMFSSIKNVGFEGSEEIFPITHE